MVSLKEKAGGFFMDELIYSGDYVDEALKKEKDKNYSLPKFSQFNPEIDDSLGVYFDSQDFVDLSDTMVHLVKQNHALIQVLNKTKVDLYRARELYDHQFREAYLGYTDGTENYKKEMASRDCENLKINLDFLDEKAKELERRSLEIRFKMDVLKTISFNLRKELELK